MSDDLKARVAYLRGYIEGQELGEDTKEQKILHKIASFLEDLAAEVGQLQEDYEDLFEYTEALDDDLTELEEDFYEEDDEDDDCDDDDDYAEGFSVECPNCREIVVVGDDILDADSAIEITCPGCGETVLMDEEGWEEEIEELLEGEDD